MRVFHGTYTVIPSHLVLNRKIKRDAINRKFAVPIPLHPIYFDTSWHGFFGAFSDATRGVEKKIQNLHIMYHCPNSGFERQTNSLTRKT